MSEEVPAILTEPAANSVPASSLGGALRAARQTAQLDIEEVARKLCLSPRQLNALENDDLQALPSPAFTRGFIRNYARLLGLDPNPLLAVYRDLVPQTTEASAISLHSEGIPIQAGDRRTWLPYVAAAALVVVAGLAWTVFQEWSQKRSAVAEPAVQAQPVAPAQPAASAPPVVVPAPEPTPMPPADAAASGVPATAPPLPAAPQAETAPASPAASAPVPSAQLSLHFTEQSWVRVQDRDGAEVFGSSKPAGSDAAVSGNPPFKVEIGNAAGVQLTYKGHPVDLAPHTKANVSRLTLE